MCLGVFLLGFIWYGTLCAFWPWVTISFPILGTFLTIISLNILSDPFFFSSSSGTPIIWMLLCLMLSQRSLTVLSSFQSVFFILLLGSYFKHSVCQLTYSFFCFSYSAIASFKCIYHFSYCVVHLCLFFSSSRSLLNISFIFSMNASILFQRFWIIFTIITLNSFSGRLPISSSFIWSCIFLPCSFIFNIFFVISFFFFNGWDCLLLLWLFGLWLPALEFVSCWVELGLGAKMRTSGRPYSDEYSLWSEVVLYLFSGLDLELPSQEPWPDPQPMNQDPRSCTEWQKKKRNRTIKSKK